MQLATLAPFGKKFDEDYKVNPMTILQYYCFITGCVTPSLDTATTLDGEDNIDAVANVDESQYEPDVPSSSHDFKQWIVAHPSYDENLIRADLDGGFFGGKISPTAEFTRPPIVFVHGNSDRAYGGPFGGWRVVYDGLRVYGYEEHELYATTYGPADVQYADQYKHSCEYLYQVRPVIKAVLEYTESDEIHIIAHSLGVTMARKAIIGGTAIDESGVERELGESLIGKVHTFIGIAGANLGLSQCYGIDTPVCSRSDGLHPGDWNGWSVINPSRTLEEINSRAGTEAAKIYSLWGPHDNVVGWGCMVWGKNTCHIPEQDDSISKSFLDHFALRDESITEIINWLESP